MGNVASLWKHPEASSHSSTGEETRQERHRGDKSGRTASRKDALRGGVQPLRRKSGGRKRVVRVRPLSSRAHVPWQAHSDDAGYDLASAERVSIPAGERRLVGTQLSFELPADCYGRVAPRSGLASKNWVDVCAGVVDAGYRGEVRVLLHNHARSSAFEVNPGDRIAQLIIERIARPVWEIHAGSAEAPFGEGTTEAAAPAERGPNGFGSTDATTFSPPPAVAVAPEANAPQ